MKVDGSGNVELVEEDGIDYAAVTVQLPGGERVPFLFTVKNLQVREGGGERGREGRGHAALLSCGLLCRPLDGLVALPCRVCCERSQLAWHWVCASLLQRS